MQRKSLELVEKIICEKSKDRLIDLTLKADNEEEFGKIVKGALNYFYENIALSSLDLGVKSGKILDLGTQFGLCGLAIAKQEYPFEIISLQDSKNAIRIGKKFAENDLVEEKIEWVNGKISEIPFRDRSLDLIISAFDLHHWENPIDVFNEINRVLKRNGAFLICDFRRDVLKPIAPILKAISYLTEQNAIYKELKHSFACSYTKSEIEKIIPLSSLKGSIIEKDLQFIYIKKERPVKRRILVKFANP
ncbi:MAG: class I SAM-dependent methyltransferase [Candidatus Aenigmatarchaeota archaeon]